MRFGNEKQAAAPRMAIRNSLFGPAEDGKIEMAPESRFSRRSSRTPGCGAAMRRRSRGGTGRLPRPRLASTAHEIALADGDRLVVLESTPAGWEGTRPTAMLVHGLAGCAEASYVVRLGARLVGWGSAWSG